MPHLTVMDWLLDLFSSALQCLIVMVIFRRKLYKSFPAFTGYTIFQLLKTVFLHIELTLPVSFLTYSYSAWSAELCDVGLELWVVYEVFKTVLEPYEAMKRSWRFMFLISGAALVLANLLWIAYEPAIRVFLDLVRSVRLIQVGLLLVIFALSRLMGLSWKSYCFGVALGFGTYAASEMVAMEMRRHYGWAVWNLLNTIRSLAYANAILIWAWYFFQPVRVAQPIRVVPQNNIEKWNHALELMLARRSG
jgi:hypothetical protein